MNAKDFTPEALFSTIQELRTVENPKGLVRNKDSSNGRAIVTSKVLLLKTDSKRLKLTRDKPGFSKAGVTMFDIIKKLLNRVPV